MDNKYQDIQVYNWKIHSYIHLIKVMKKNISYLRRDTIY